MTMINKILNGVFALMLCCAVSAELVAYQGRQMEAELTALTTSNAQLLDDFAASVKVQANIAAMNRAAFSVLDSTNP